MPIMPIILKRVLPLVQFVIHVPGVGMVVGKPARDADPERGRAARQANVVAVLPQQAEKLVRDGKAQYADPVGEDGAGADIVHGKTTQRDRRLAARAARRAAKAGVEKVREIVTGDPAPRRARTRTDKPQLDHDKRDGAGGSPKGANSTAARAAGKDVSDQFDAGGFTVTLTGGIGMYQIAGGDLDGPVIVKGKKKTQALLDELKGNPLVSGGTTETSSDAPID